MNTKRQNKREVEVSCSCSITTGHIIDVILTKGGQKLLNKYLATKFPQHMAKTYAKIFDQVSFEELRNNDTGETITTLMNSWAEEEPPVNTESIYS